VLKALHRSREVVLTLYSTNDKEDQAVRT